MSYFNIYYSDGYSNTVDCADAQAAHKEGAKEAIGRYIKTISDDRGIDTFFDIGQGGWVDPAEARRNAAKAVKDDTLLEAVRHGILSLGNYKIVEEGQRLQITPIPVFATDLKGAGLKLGIRERTGKKEIFRTFNVEIKVTEILPITHKWVEGICENCKADLFEVVDPSGDCKQ